MMYRSDNGNGHGNGDGNGAGPAPEESVGAPGLGVIERSPAQGGAEGLEALQRQVDSLLESTRWEYLSLIVWDDDARSQVTSDLEDVEVLNELGLEGWELVCVVPLARTQVLEMAYPGNTRKLLAYFKRQVP